MNLPLKVRFLNFFRNFFRIRPLEGALASLTANNAPDSFFAKFVPNPYQYSSNTFRVVDRDGIKMNVDISDYIGHYIFFGFKDASVHGLMDLCKPGANVIDVGTNVGWTLLHLAKLSGTGTVFGFEPDPYNYNQCRENIGLNTLKNIRLFPVGLSDVTAQLTMEVRVASNRGGNRINTSSDGHKVDVVRLDDFEAVKSVNTIDLIKIDVEGYEMNVLKGAARLLQQHHPVLFIELDDNNLKDQGHSAKELIEFLNNAGYRNIKSADDGHTVSSTDNFSNCHFDIIAS